MATAHPTKPRLTDEEVLQFKYEDFSPVEANQNGEYPSIRLEDNRSLERWSELVRDGLDFMKQLPFPPLLLNEDIIDKAVIVIYGWRREDTFNIVGLFHSQVPETVSDLNVQMNLSVTFTKLDNTTLTLDKQVVADVEHERCQIFTFYDVPFASFSSSVCPVANISIRKSLPEQKWFYFGLAPLIGSHGEFDAIDCKSLIGTYDGAREWMEMLKDPLSGYLHNPCFLYLPPLRLSSEIADDATMCVYCGRNQEELRFHAKFHWSTPQNVKYREILFKIDLQVTMRDKSIFQRQAETRFSLKRNWTYYVISFELPFDTFSSAQAPRIRISILPAN